MKKALLLFLVLSVYVITVAQSTYHEDSLRKELSHARTVPDRLYWMSELGTYYVGFNDTLAEEYEAKIITLADSSRNREWMTRAYLYNANQYYRNMNVKQYSNKGLDYSQRALDIAKRNNLVELTAWSYLYMARGAVRNSENVKALNYNNLAMSLAADIDNDSLKTYVYNALGDVYLEKNEKLQAFRHYLHALDIAEQNGEYRLLEECYTRMSTFYTTLEDYEKAKDFEFKKEALQQKYHKLHRLLNTYRSIANLYKDTKQYSQALQYFEKAIKLAKDIHYEIYNLNTYLDIIQLYTSTGQYQKSLEYLNAQKELKDFFNNAGMGYFIDEAYGAHYMFIGNLDSAGYYLKKVERDYEKNTSKWELFSYYTRYATYYRLRSDYDNAIAYWIKAKDLVQQIGNLDYLAVTANNLDSLYQLKGDYKTAHTYQALYVQYKDSLQKLSKEKDLMSLEIDNENKRKEREAKKQEEATRRNHNIQYMAITIAIAAVFILLVMAGVFSVSKTTIKVLGFFAFIFLFEFIILIADNQIHHITHGEPWKVLAIKIGLIAILLPLHHTLEERVIHYLITQEKLRLKGKGLMRKWFKKKSADVPMGNV